MYAAGAWVVKEFDAVVWTARAIAVAPIVRHKFLRREIFCALKIGVTIVAYAQRVVIAVVVNPRPEARRIELPARHRIVAHRPTIMLGEFGAMRRVRYRRMMISANHNCLHTLGTHHRADAHSRGLITAFSDDAGEAHPILAGWTDDGGVNVGAKFLFERVHRFGNSQSPERLSVVKFHRAVFDHNGRSTLRRAVNDERVRAAAFERHAKRSLAARLADAAGERAFRRRSETRQTRVRMTGDNARSEDEQVCGIESVHAARTFAQKIVRGKQTTAAVDSPETFVWLFNPGAARAQINVKDFAVIAVATHKEFTSCNWSKMGTSAA